MNIFEYFGNFHPLVVHLPIGFLVVFLLLGLFIPRQKLIDAYSIIRLILLTSALFATASSITGYILSISGSYDQEVVSNHKWFGIVLTIVNWIIYFKLDYLLHTSIRNFRLSLVFVLVMLTVTGHAGGSLTHGSEFLTPPPPDQWLAFGPKEKRKITMSSTALEATSIILEENCYACHGRSKQKGELRLDSKEAILKGGEDGKIIAEHAADSRIMELLLLPIDDDDHMPPKEKKQLADVEINYLAWWIDHAINEEKTLEELELPDSLHGILYEEEIQIINNLVPDKDVKEADEKALERLNGLGVTIFPIESDANFLSANFANMLPENITPAMQELEKVKSQLIWLNLDYHQLTPEAWTALSKLENLRKFSVRNTNMDDEFLVHLSPLKSLVYLNLVDTKVTDEGLLQLKELQKLESLFLYQTMVGKNAIASLTQMFPLARIDTGNYFVPTLVSDTTIFHK